MENLNAFEQAGDDLQKLYYLLVRGEPTPDEEILSKEKILEFLKVIQQAPEGERVKDLVEQAIAIASSWDVYDFWFKEVKDLPRIVGEILATLKPDTISAPSAPKEAIPLKLEAATTSPTKLASESFPQGSPGANLEDLVAKVTGQFKSQIEALQGKISNLEKSFDEKDQEIEKVTHVGGNSEAATVPAPGRPVLKPKLQAPKLKLPAVLVHKPVPMKMEEKTAPETSGAATTVPSQNPVGASPSHPSMKSIAVKPIAIKPLIITPKVREKPALELVQVSIPKPVSVRQMSPKPVPIKRLGEDDDVEEPANLQSIPTKPAVLRPIMGKPVTIKPVSVQPASIKPFAIKSAAPLLEEEESSDLQSLSPKSISAKPVSIITGSSKPVFTKPIASQPRGESSREGEPIPVKIVSVQHISVKSNGVQSVNGLKRPVSVTPAEPMQIKPISAKPINIKPISAEPMISPGATLASTLSSIGRPTSPSPESVTAIRPLMANSAAEDAAGVNVNGSQPESKTELYSELIALEGRRFATERRKKELDDQLEKGKLGQADYQSAVSRADTGLQDISNRINSIRQKLSTL